MGYGNTKYLIQNIEKDAISEQKYKSGENNRQHLENVEKQ